MNKFENPFIKIDRKNVIGKKRESQYYQPEMILDVLHNVREILEASSNFFFISLLFVQSVNQLDVRGK